MGLKLETDKFLQGIKAMRDAAVADAEQKALQIKHEPYKAQMVATRDKALVAEEQQFRKIVEQLTAEHNSKVTEIRADFDGSIAKHRTLVAQEAKAEAEAEYNKFILGVASVADDVKIN